MFSEQRGSTVGQRGDCLHPARRRQRRNPALHREGAGDGARGRADRDESDASQCHRQGRHVP